MLLDDLWEDTDAPLDMMWIEEEFLRVRDFDRPLPVDRMELMDRARRVRDLFRVSFLPRDDESFPDLSLEVVMFVLDVSMEVSAALLLLRRFLTARRASCRVL